MDVKPRLVEDWRSAWRWWSVRFLTLLAAVGPVWLSLPPEMQDDIPVEWLPYVSPVVLMSVVVSRLLAQPSVPGGE